jgi:hypothetical protein
VLVVAADRRRQPLGQRGGGRYRAGQHDAGTVQDHGETGFREQVGGLGDRRRAAARMLDPDDLRQLDIDHLGPVVAGHIDLRRRRAAQGLEDHPVQDFGHARGIAHLLLIAHHVLEEGHLLDLLKAALADGLVGGLRCHQEQRRVVPVGGDDRRHHVGNAGAVLGDRHGHLARGPRVAVGAHPGVHLMGAIPEPDACGREQV